MGYRIPKGAVIVTNIWAYTHDPAVYPEPLLFKPERFLTTKPAPPDPTSFVFGFGRRVCPGRNLADTSVWLSIAQSLACFNITRSPAAAGTGAQANSTINVPEPASRISAINANGAARKGVSNSSLEESSSEALTEYFRPGTISQPVPFDVDVRVRSERHAELIRAVERDAPWGESDAKKLETEIRERLAREG